MSYNSELQSNNTDLQTILDTVNNLPKAGGSGSGGIETCTLTLSIDSSAYLSTYAYSYVDDNNKVNTNYINFGTNRKTNIDITLNNVVCGSFLYIFISGPSLGIYSTYDDFPLDECGNYFKAPSTKDAVETLRFVGDD